MSIPADKMNKDVTPADKDGYDLKYYPSTGWRYIAIKTDEQKLQMKNKKKI